MKKALLVGIDNYPSSPLHGCINDVNSLERTIEAHGDGSPNFEVRVAKDISTKSVLKKLIVDLFSGSADTVLFYFSGHGFLNELGGYIVTPDHQKYDEGISMNEILILANQSKAKDKIIILDCCNSGAISTSPQGAGSIELSEGLSILTASRDDESAVAVNGHSVFTNLLLGALNGGAADLRGHISPGGVYSYIDQALGAWEQRPVFKTNVSRFTSLRKIDPQVPLATLRKVVDYFPSSDVEFALDPSFEDTNKDTVPHKVIEPCANEINVSIFKDLQKLQSVGLIIPVNTDYMYFAAMESKSCKLTALGSHYWRLVKDKRI